MRLLRPTGLLIGSFLCVSIAGLRADVQVHHLFTRGAVLQQGLPVPVWGTARDGERVVVDFAGQKRQTTAKHGRWMVRLGPLRVFKEGQTLTVHGDNTITVPDILVGEVWICSGQSNMQWPVEPTVDGREVVATANDPQIRLFTVPREATGAPLTDVTGTWQRVSPETVKEFSAVAYAFGKALRKARNVPIGLISTNYGGTPAEAWTRRELVEQEFPSIVEAQRLAAVAPTNPNSAGGLYNAMIAPLIPFAIRGAIWYQGESNAGRAWEYRKLFPEMIRNWREDWGEGDFPFLFVQLAPWMAITTQPTESAWAELREAQLLTLTTSPNTGMAVITDLGDEKDIHPRRKTPVGERLALAARRIAYRERIPYSGPIYNSMNIHGNQVVLHFKNTDGGLRANGKLVGFTIAGEDRRFVNAEARIEGNSVVVSAPRIERPIAVRYGWANYPVVNLTNGAGLPASPFRTDDFPVTTQPR